jgi:hypothetical protein
MKKVFCIIMVSALAVAVSPVQAQHKYKAYFDSLLAANVSTFNSWAASGNGDTYYSFQYILLGVIGMYEGTDQLIYLEQALKWSETIVSKATIVDIHGKRNWKGIWQSPYASVPISYLLEEMQVSAELARLARIILSNSALSAYHARARVLRDFVNIHIVEKHLYSRSGGEAWFINISTNRSYAYSDKTAFLVRIMAELNRMGITRYAALTKKLADLFLVRIQPYINGSIIWDYKVGWVDGHSMDTSHASRYPVMAIDLMNSGISMTRNHITGIARLFTEVIWDRSLSSPQFTNYIDGVNDMTYGRGPYAGGAIYSGWPALGGYDVKAQQVAEAVLDAIIRGVQNPSLNYNSTIYGKMALSGWLTMNRAILSGVSPAPAPDPEPSPTPVPSVDTDAPTVSIISPANGTVVKQ